MKVPTFLEQFQNFCEQNKPKDMQQALDAFTIFGGLGENIDLTKPLMFSIEKHILFNYKTLHNELSSITKGHAMYHAILSGVALGNSQTHTAYKRAGISQEAGNTALSFLTSTGMVTREWSKAKKSKENISDKVHFTTPFFRFWFAFISPIFKGIQQGDFKEFNQRFENQFSEFVAYTFKQLSLELVKKTFEEDTIVTIGSYWDKEINIDIVAKTTSGKTIVGVCKYTNNKLKKSELTSLQEQCKKVGIEADIFVLIAKEGFSKELKSLKSETIRFFTLKSFKRVI